MQVLLIEVMRGLEQEAIRDFFDEFLFKLVGALNNTSQDKDTDKVNVMMGVSDSLREILRSSGITSGKKVKFYLHPDRCKFGDAQEMFKKFAQSGTE